MTPRCVGVPPCSRRPSPPSAEQKPLYRSNKKIHQTKLCESGNVVFVFARKMCNIRFSDGSRSPHRAPRIRIRLVVFQSGPQVTKCLLVPSATRTSQNTNAPEETQTRLDFSRLFSLSRLKPPVFFISSVTIVFFQVFRHLFRCLFSCLILYYYYLLHMYWPGFRRHIQFKEFRSRWGRTSFRTKLQKLLSKPNCVFHQ